MIYLIILKSWCYSQCVEMIEQIVFLRDSSYYWKFNEIDFKLGLSFYCNNINIIIEID